MEAAESDLLVYRRPAVIKILQEEREIGPTLSVIFLRIQAHEKLNSINKNFSYQGNKFFLIRI